MFKAPKIVLVWKSGDETLLGPFVQECCHSGVRFIGVVGANCEHIHDVIDEHIIGDGSANTPFILTSWHTDETVDEAIEFAKMLTGEYEGDVEIVTL